MSRSPSQSYGGNSMVAKLRRVLVYPPVAPDAGVSWEGFGYFRPVDHGKATEEHAAFRRMLADAGSEVIVGELDDPALQDGIFPFDPALMTDAGAILCRMGKPLREREVEVMAATLRDLGVPIVGRIVAPGTVEGGDCCWIDARTLAVGQGYRTNGEGIRQLAAILGPLGVRVVIMPLPHWHGPDECLHLLSLISPIDERLAVVYRPLLSVPFLDELAARGYELIDIPEGEFTTQGCNVLALGPRRCVMLRDNVETVGRLRAAGCEVLTYAGDEISHNRSGGPTCLTRPLWRG